MSSEPGIQPDGPAAETDQQEPMSITDPTVMRALAHPVRMALIELFGVHPTLTATQASEALGESPANCAFHLRTLAKYGFVEEAGGGRGRERPWRASTKSLRIRLRSADLDDRRRGSRRARSSRSGSSAGSSGSGTSSLNRRCCPAGRTRPGGSQTLTFLTPEEMRAMRDEINAIVSRHLDERRVDPARRPAGALPVESSRSPTRGADWTAMTPATTQPISRYILTAAKQDAIHLKSPVPGITRRSRHHEPGTVLQPGRRAPP